jgi:outer membrane protein
LRLSAHAHAPRRLLVLALAVLGSGALAAERITNIGILDLRRVTTSYFRESRAVRDLEEMRAQVDAKRARLEAEIYDLEARRLQARTDGDRQDVLALDQRLFEQRQYLRDYITVKNQQLAQQQERLAESDSFLDDLAAAIAFVAESEGLSLVMDRNNNGVLFFVPEIDVTDLVIAELGRRSGRN